MRMPKMKTKWLYVGAALSALVLVPIGAVLASPMPCITESRGCDKDVLCAFKIDLAEKIIAGTAKFGGGRRSFGYTPEFADNQAQCFGEVVRIQAGGDDEVASVFEEAGRAVDRIGEATIFANDLEEP